MTSISNILSEEFSVFGYQINVGQALTTGLVIASAATYAIKKLWINIHQNEPLPLISDKTFWERIEQVPIVVKENEPIVIGNARFKNLSEMQKQMFLSCTQISDHVQKHLFQSNFKGTVLDLGCGIGANSIPLVIKGCQVTAIDKLKDVILQYRSIEEGYLRSYQIINHIQEQNEICRSNSIVGDIAEVDYPTNIDAVICVDTLPYLHPHQLKTTLNKIFQALQPGGKFIGTLFFKSRERGTRLTEAMSKMGAHFYLGKSVVREMVIRSGFNIIDEKERPGCSFFDRSICLEFLAEKPIAQ